MHENMTKNLEEIFAEIFGQSFSPLVKTDVIIGSKIPPINLSVNKDSTEIKVEVAVAGYDNVSVTTDANTLVIEGVCSEKTDTQHYIQKDITNRSFKRGIRIPNTTDYDKIKAQWDKSGLLVITLPIKESARPKKIKIYNS